MQKNSEIYYVGHRGSRGVDVENTMEAFQEGINRGYRALECDVRVSKDNQFIIFHDEDLVRLAGKNELVSNLTWDELKDIILRQNYQENILTGNIPTLKEYLLLCKETQTIPVIELKWSTGINNNDCSNVEALINLIEECGLLEEAIILTSMRNVLIYLRTHYPSINLQILLGASQSLSDEILSFAFNNNISLDLHYSLVSQEIIDLAHQNNVFVNCWCVNTYPQRDEFLKMGIDMITTDDLK